MMAMPIAIIAKPILRIPISFLRFACSSSVARSTVVLLGHSHFGCVVLVDDPVKRPACVIAEVLRVASRE